MLVQGVWQFERRMVEVRQEHGLNQFDLEKSPGPAGPCSTQEALAGLSQEAQALLCSPGEAAARAAALEAEDCLRALKARKLAPADESAASDADAGVEQAAERSSLAAAMPPAEPHSAGSACLEVQAVMGELLDAACALESGVSRGGSQRGVSGQAEACGSPGSAGGVPAEPGAHSAPSPGLPDDEQRGQAREKSGADGAVVGEPGQAQGSLPAPASLQQAAGGAEALVAAQDGCAPAAAGAPEAARASPSPAPAEDACTQPVLAAEEGSSLNMVADTQLDESGRPLLHLDLDTQLEAPGGSQQQQPHEGPCPGAAAAQALPAAEGTPLAAEPASHAEGGAGSALGGSKRGEAGEEQLEGQAQRPHLSACGGSERGAPAREEQQEGEHPASATQDAWTCVLTDVPAGTAPAPSGPSGAWRTRAPRGAGAAASGQAPRTGASPPAVGRRPASPGSARAAPGSVGLRLRPDLGQRRLPRDSWPDSSPQRPRRQPS